MVSVGEISQFSSPLNLIIIYLLRLAYLIEALTTIQS